MRLWIVSLVLSLSAMSTAASKTLVIPPGEEAEQLSAQRRIEAALETYAGVPAIAPIADIFKGKIEVSRFAIDDDGTPFRRMSRSEYAGPPENVLEIVLFSDDLIDNPKIQGDVLWYDVDWDVIFCIDTAWSDPSPWFEALMFHEMYHAMRIRRGFVDFRESLDSDAWYAEEVGAHDIVRQVLSLATDGAYETLLKSIVASAPRSPNGVPLVTRTEEEILETLFAKPPSLEYGLRRAQMFYDINAVWIETSLPVTAWHASKIGLYRFVRFRAVR